MTDPQPPKSVRVLVVDDSAYNRRSITDIFAAAGDVEVVGKAADGEEALRLATNLQPDVITLDLEMPRMDGFTFLRILKARQPSTQVIVVSSYSQTENSFKALELGAFDFVAKGDSEFRNDLLDKVRNAPGSKPTSRKILAVRRAAREAIEVTEPLLRAAPKAFLSIASSTGGPTALLDIFNRIPATLSSNITIAQHMPDKFTRTFAERLNKRGTFRVTEAQDGDSLLARTAFVCPGRQCMEVVASPTGGDLRLRIGLPSANDRYVPSADRLFRSLAVAVQSKAIGVVLTGMGDDGLAGARAIRDAGGVIVAESEESAVVFGMPGMVVRAGLANHVLPLPQIADFIRSLG